jgi:hypothetical protein
MSAMAMATRVEDLTLSINEEIHVKAPVEVTFDTLLEQLGSLMGGAEDRPMPMKIEPWPGGRWYRDLGDDQAADAAGILRAADDVVSGEFERAIPAERRGRRNADQIPPPGARRDSCGPP